MEQKPLWKIDSGEFAGWRIGDQLHDAKGAHVGMFRGDVAYTLKGEYLGEIVDGEWLGKHITRRPPPIAARESRGSVHSTPRAPRSGRSSKLWEDPKI